MHFLKIFLVAMGLSVILNATANPNILRVGTTGDYPPLTFLNPQTHQYQGTDITLIEAFAKAEHLQIQFVQTTWPTLSQDLLADRFDLAIGGISDSPERQQQFLVSNPIGYTGKIPLVRCADVTQYQTLAAINQPNVRVVENVGGTNLSFAKQSVPKAQLIIVQNNQAPFVYLSQNKADVMLTDSTEAIYRQQITPGLCAVNPTHFLSPATAKVVLFRKDEESLQHEFNLYLFNLATVSFHAASQS